MYTVKQNSRLNFYSSVGNNNMLASAIKKKKQQNTSFDFPYL